MTADLEDRLTHAVEELTEPRIEHTTITDDEGNWIRVESVRHPSLIETLLTVPGGTRNGGSSDPGIPIDADALEIMAQISEHLSLWSRHLRFDYHRSDTLNSLRSWKPAHDKAVRDGHVSYENETIVTRTVESWVRMIVNKFAPDEVREWKHACPKCGARRIIVDDTERFAIRVNVTQVTATCGNCGALWSGTKMKDGVPSLSELRYAANTEHDTPKPDAVENVAAFD